MRSNRSGPDTDHNMFLRFLFTVRRMVSAAASALAFQKHRYHAGRPIPKTAEIHHDRSKITRWLGYFYFRLCVMSDASCRVCRKGGFSCACKQSVFQYRLMSRRGFSFWTCVLSMGLKSNVLLVLFSHLMARVRRRAAGVPKSTSRKRLR